MSNKRVVSLLPSATEIVCVLGASSQLVGRSHECDAPAEILSLPVCTSAKINSAAASVEIERETKTLLKSGLPLYKINAAELERLRPDLIITQAQCEVCAVSLAEVEQIVSHWRGNHPQILALSPTRLTDVWDDIRRVSDALELGEPGRDILRALKNRVVNIIEKTCAPKRRPRVFCMEWIEPPMAAGNWVPELVELAGGSNILGHAGKHSEWCDWKTIQTSDPESIIVMPCGFVLKRTRAELAVLEKNPEWKKLRAVKNRQVYLTDGNGYFNRPGPRIVESIETLAEILWPKKFDFGHKNKTWQVY